MTFAQFTDQNFGCKRIRSGDLLSQCLASNHEITNTEKMFRITLISCAMSVVGFAEFNEFPSIYETFGVFPLLTMSVSFIWSGTRCCSGALQTEGDNTQRVLQQQDHQIPAVHQGRSTLPSPMFMGMLISRGFISSQCHFLVNGWSHGNCFGIRCYIIVIRSEDLWDSWLCFTTSAVLQLLFWFRCYLQFT